MKIDQATGQTCNQFWIYSDFQEFKQFENFNFCLDLNLMNSFLNMIHLITRKSSFSYKLAFKNRGIKICPKDFWKGFPTTDEWVFADNRGKLLNELHFQNE
jgi:hypothetical protein